MSSTPDQGKESTQEPDKAGLTQNDITVQAHYMALMRSDCTIMGDKAWILHRALTHNGAKPEEMETLRNLGQAPAEDIWSADQRNTLTTKYYDLLLKL